MMQQMLMAMGGRNVVNISVGAQNNYVANVAKVSGYQSGNTDVTFTITGTVGSASTGAYAFDVDTSWAAGDTVTVIVNSGVYLVGAGGSGGVSSGVFNPNGYPGGPAIRVQRAINLTNNGIVGGGGGGGGIGYAYDYSGGSGGGGGQGQIGGGGGCVDGFSCGNSGSVSAPGSAAYNAGAGGALGASGQTGSAFDFISGGLLYYPGGAGGAALVGKALVNGGAGILGTVYGGQA